METTCTNTIQGKNKWDYHAVIQFKQGKQSTVAHDIMSNMNDFNWNLGSLLVSYMVENEKETAWLRGTFKVTIGILDHNTHSNLFHY